MQSVRPGARAKVFYSNRSQAVRLPKDVAFPESVTEVQVLVVGDALLLKPAPRGWDELFRNPAFHAAPDFLHSRDEPEVQERDW